ncbi:MAG TPA: sugar transferase, partial [Treponemataceae bacterium]|nr:sugar transferase [Treponemataceae bacterium]
MKQISRKRRQFIIFLIDVLILFLSIPLTLTLRKFQVPSLISIFEHWITFLPMIIFWELLMYGAGMYALEKPFKGTSVVLKMSLIASVSLLTGFTLFYLLL